MEESFVVYVSPADNSSRLTGLAGLVFQKNNKKLGCGIKIAKKVQFINYLVREITNGAEISFFLFTFRSTAD